MAFLFLNCELNYTLAPKLINDIKWDIYKTQLLNNLGLRVVNDDYQGDLIVSHNRSKSTYYDYPLKNILKLIKN
jgi:hypothetical protein